MEMAIGMSQREADRGDYRRGNDEGGKMKETGTTHWDSPNTGATNTVFFTALPGGQRNDDGLFRYRGDFSTWWSSAEHLDTDAWTRGLSSVHDMVFRGTYSKSFSFSIRCLKE